MFSTDLNRRMRFFEDASTHNDRVTNTTFLQTYNPVRLVFNTTELLELILLELDMKTLLLSQATNQMFNQTIMTSPRLRQKLWFDEDPKLAKTSKPEPMLNPLLQSVVTKGKHSHIRFLELEYSSLDFYPALSRRLKPFEPPTVCIAMAPKARIAKWTGSWRRMLVVQPYDLSTRWDAYHYRWATREWDFRFTGTFDDGVPTMGRVVRFALGPGFEGKDNA
ncbi:hypothetical protein Slin15195_G094340 [Septoria linicola]|uniref:F-box domain-containing protein n=1 Tax=Septoria linicola TaxID=215465 RepID=A0A9Q9EMJ7_9PEZI|nr:hypothetical protein Slin15195_G094340 [Septoria linicola]